MPTLRQVKTAELIVRPEYSASRGTLMALPISVCLNQRIST